MRTQISMMEKGPPHCFFPNDWYAPKVTFRLYLECRNVDSQNVSFLT